MEFITIQDSFDEVIKDIESGDVADEKFWIAKRTQEGDQDLREVSYGKDKFKRISDCKYEYENKYVLITPKSRITLRDIKKNQGTSKITASAVSLYGDFVVLGINDGDILVYSISDSKMIHEIKGAHFSDVIHIRIFPSNKVILSVGLDMKCKIWPIDATEPVRTITGQTQEITDVKLLGSTGRNFLTSSKDGSVALSETGSGKIIYLFRRVVEDAANCFTVGMMSQNGTKQSELEFETEGKALYVGYESGVIQQYDIMNHTSTGVKFKSEFSVESIDIADKFLVTGHSNGDLIIWDLETKKLVHKTKFDTVLRIKIVGLKSGALSELVYAGPENLFVSTFDNKIEQLVGFPEMFKVQNIERSNGIAITTEECIAFFDI